MYRELAPALEAAKKTRHESCRSADGRRLAVVGGSDGSPRDCVLVEPARPARWSLTLNTAGMPCKEALKQKALHWHLE